MNIYLDSSLYPYLSEFQYAIQIETKYNYLLNFSTPGFMPPEFIEDFKLNQDSFALDVYAYGMSIFTLINGKNPFIGFNQDEILVKTKKGFHFEFPKNTKQCWKNLITKCCSFNPSERPSFTEICDEIENDEFSNEASINTNDFIQYKKIINRNH